MVNFTPEEMEYIDNALKEADEYQENYAQPPVPFEIFWEEFISKRELELNSSDIPNYKKKYIEIGLNIERRKLEKYKRKISKIEKAINKSDIEKIYEL